MHVNPAILLRITGIALIFDESETISLFNAEGEAQELIELEEGGASDMRWSPDSESILIRLPSSLMEESEGGENQEDHRSAGYPQDITQYKKGNSNYLLGNNPLVWLS